jgi:hypothetical protein
VASPGCCAFARSRTVEVGASRLATFPVFQTAVMPLYWEMGGVATPPQVCLTPCEATGTMLDRAPTMGTTTRRGAMTDEYTRPGKHGKKLQP